MGIVEHKCTVVLSCRWPLEPVLSGWIYIHLTCLDMSGETAELTGWLSLELQGVMREWLECVGIEAEMQVRRGGLR